MVDDRITDGRRIAQLLASELDGRSDGPLDRVAVVNADPDADPTAAGARAYDIAVEGSTVASVVVHAEGARIVVSEGIDGLLKVADARGLRTGDDEPAVVVEDGAAVKLAVSALTTTLDREE